MLPLGSVSSRLFAALVLLIGVAPPASAVSWFDDFNDGNAEDGNPVTWTYNEIGFTPGTYDASSGDYILSNPDGVGTDDSMLPTVAVNFTDTYVRTQAVVLPGMLPDQIGGTLGVVARWDPQTVSGYAALLSNGAHLQLLRADAGSPMDLAEAENLPIDTASDAIIELNAVGELLSVYLWRPGEPKPSEPVVTAIDPHYTSGRAGLLHNENDDGVQGVFRFAAAQDMPFIDTLDGDFNNDGSVDAADYVTWRNGPNPTPEDYSTWRANFGRTAASATTSSLDRLQASAAVPEPTEFTVLAWAASWIAAMRRGRNCRPGKVQR